jgi:hypothetical protein
MRKSQTVLEESISQQVVNTDADENNKQQLTQLISNPNFTELLSLTNLPLAQINALAWTLAFADYAEYCKNRYENRMLPDGDKDKKKIQPVLLEKLYVDYYCRLRESLEGENKMHLVTLARDQMSSENEQGNPMINLDKMPRQ